MTDFLELNNILSNIEEEDYSHKGPSYAQKEQVFSMIRKEIETGKTITATGNVEIMVEGFGFLRTNGYCSGNWDVYISNQVIKNNNIKKGDNIVVNISKPNDNDRNLSAAQVTKLHDEPISKKRRVRFESLEAIYPEKKIVLESTAAVSNISMRIIDLFSPIGRGQRAMIVAPPRTGKTEMLADMIRSIRHNYPEIKVLALLIDERPEEVPPMKVAAGAANVISSTFDEPPLKHVQVAELAIERAKRMVEMGYDVVLFIDSITRLTRAFNHVIPQSRKILSGGLDSASLYPPKSIMGAARNSRTAGSLTIVATVLVDTGSKMDEVIFEEFKGTVNCQIILDQDLANKRIYPAYNIEKSGTRKEELILSNLERALIPAVRKVLGNSNTQESLEIMLNAFKNTANNSQLLQCIKDPNESKKIFN